MFVLTKGACSSLGMFQIVREGYMEFPPPVSGLVGHKVGTATQSPKEITRKRRRRRNKKRRRRKRRQDIGGTESGDPVPNRRYNPELGLGLCHPALSSPFLLPVGLYPPFKVQQARLPRTWCPS